MNTANANWSFLLEFLYENYIPCQNESFVDRSENQKFELLVNTNNFWMFGRLGTSIQWLQGQYQKLQITDSTPCKEMFFKRNNKEKTKNIKEIERTSYGLKKPFTV